MFNYEVMEANGFSAKLTIQATSIEFVDGTITTPTLIFLNDSMRITAVVHLAPGESVVLREIPKEKEESNGSKMSDLQGSLNQRKHLDE